MKDIDPFDDRQRGPVLSVRFIVALALMVLGIAWIVYYYVAVRPDPTVLDSVAGSPAFMADLVRAIHLPLHVDFLIASSYGSDKVSSGDVQLLYDPAASLKGRAVLIVEDIIDSGTTLNRLIPRLKARDPTSVEVCALLHKRLTNLDHEARWVGFDAPNEFLVGYGLDYAEDFRHLPYVASL